MSSWYHERIADGTPSRPSFGLEKMANFLYSETPLSPQVNLVLTLAGHWSYLEVFVEFAHNWGISNRREAWRWQLVGFVGIRWLVFTKG